MYVNSCVHEHGGSFTLVEDNGKYDSMDKFSASTTWKGDNKLTDWIEVYMYEKTCCYYQITKNEHESFKVVGCSLLQGQKNEQL